MTAFLLENLSIFLGAAGCVFGAVLAAVWVVRYRIPALIRKTEDNAARIAALEASERAYRDMVKKHELYDVDGQARYMHRADCLRMREGCMREQGEDMAAIRATLREIAGQLEEMDARRQAARTLQISFMSAVQQKLDLKFNVPEA